MSNLLIIASLNIECEQIPGKYPSSKYNKVTQIATTFSRCGENECYLKHMITIIPYIQANDVIVEQYDNEIDALLAWTKLIQRTNPNIIVGYNIFDFDLPYLYSRTLVVGCCDEFSKLGANGEHSMSITKKKCTGAFINTVKYNFNIKGIELLDLCKYIKENYKLSSYMLHDVVNHFIKNDNNQPNFDCLSCSAYCNKLINATNIFVDV